MHRLMEQDKEGSERVNEVFSIQLHNRQLYEQGKDGVWLDMPTTTEQLQAALRQIGISADNPQDFFINGYNPQSEVFQTVLYDGNSYRNFGPYNTKAELYAALEQYTNDQTKSGNMTEVEANSILDKYR